MPTPTPIGPLGAATPSTSRSAQTELAAWPAGTKAGDVLLAVATAEAGVVPDVVAASTPTDLAAGAQGTSFARRVVLMRITRADVAVGGIRASVEASSVTRRMAVRGFVIRDAALDTQAHGAAITGGTVPSATTPSVTPGQDDRLLVALAALATTASPYIRDWPVSGSGWTGRGESESLSETSVNAIAVVATRQLTGGANTAQTGATITPSAGDLRGFLSTVALRYELAPPDIEAGPDQTVEPYATVTVTATTDRGTITWRQVSGPTVALSGSGASRTFAAPATLDGGAVVLRASAADNGSAATDDLTVFVAPHTEWHLATDGTWLPERHLDVLP